MFLYYGTQSEYHPTKAGKQVLEKAFYVEAYKDDKSLGFTVTAFPPNEVFIKTIKEDQWADSIGLEIDDEIATVNDQVVTEMTKEDFIKALKSRPLRMEIIPWLEEDELAIDDEEEKGTVPDAPQGVPTEQRETWRQMQRRKLRVRKVKAISEMHGAVRQMERDVKSGYRKTLKRLSLQDQRKKEKLEQGKKDEQAEIDRDARVRQKKEERDRKERERKEKERQDEQDQIEQDEKDKEAREARILERRAKLAEDIKEADIEKMKKLVKQQRKDFEEEISSLETRLAMLQKKRRRSKANALDAMRADMEQELDYQRDELEAEIGEYESRLRVALKNRRRVDDTKEPEKPSLQMQDMLKEEEAEVAKLRRALRIRQDLEYDSLAAGKPLIWKGNAGGAAEEVAELTMALHKSRALCKAEESTLRGTKRHEEAAVAEVQESSGETIRKLYEVLGIEHTKTGELESHDSQLLRVENRTIQEVQHMRILLRSEESVVRGLIRERGTDIEKAEKLAVGKYQNIASAEKAASRGLRRLEQGIEDRMYTAEQGYSDMRDKNAYLEESLREEQEKCRQAEEQAKTNRAYLKRLENTLQETTGENFKKMMRQLHEKDDELNQLAAERVRLSAKLDQTERDLKMAQGSPDDQVKSAAGDAGACSQHEMQISFCVGFRT